MNNSQRLPLRVVLGFALGQFGAQVCRDVPATLLLFFLTQILGLKPALAGITVLVPKIWVVIGDLAVGVASDRTRSRWGRRRPYLLSGALLAGIGLTWLFWVPDTLAPARTALYVGLVYLLLCTGQSLFGVPYLALASEITSSAMERVRLLSYRQVCLVGAVFAALAGAPLVINAYGGGISGYRVMALALGLVVCASMLAPVLIAPRDAAGARAAPDPVLADFAALARNRPFAMIIAANVTQSIAVGGTSAAAPYFITQVLGFDFGTFSAFVSASIIAALLSQPLWVWLARRIGRTRTYVLALGGHGIAGGVVLLDVFGNLRILLALGFFAGVFSAGYSLLSVSLLTDVVSADTARASNRQALMSAFYTTTERTAVAIGAFLVATILSLGGYVESHGEPVVQSAAALQSVRYAYAIVGAGAQGVSMLIAIALHRSLRAATVRPVATDPGAEQQTGTS